MSTRDLMMAYSEFKDGTKPLLTDDGATMRTDHIALWIELNAEAVAKFANACLAHRKGEK